MAAPDISNKKYDLSILIVDDAQDQLELLSLMISKVGELACRVYRISDPHECMPIIEKRKIDLVITDYMMPGMTGMDVLKQVKAANPKIDVVIMTAFADISNAVEIMKQQAFDYIVKPVRMEVLRSLLQRIFERKSVREETTPLKELVLDPQAGARNILSKSLAMEEVLSIASRSAQSDATVLLRGESGTGKELIANSIHQLSRRSGKPFVTVNLAALPHSLVESELFGHRQGAFTGANQDRKGRFADADGGTLFIDEVGDIPPETQVKILRALQFGEFERLGDNKSIQTDVRIIAATNRDLEAMIANGSFRSDLFYRLNVISIEIPPLRERKEDLLLLIDHFINKFAEKNRKVITGITDDSIDLLFKYGYPGNVRELENILERAIVLCRGEVITQQDIFIPGKEKLKDQEFMEILNPRNLDSGYNTKMHAFEKQMIDQALVLSEGNKSAAARRLGISERRLRSRIERIAEYNEED